MVMATLEETLAALLASGQGKVVKQFAQATVDRVRSAEARLTTLEQAPGPEPPVPAPEPAPGPAPPPPPPANPYKSRVGFCYHAERFSIDVVKAAFAGMVATGSPWVRDDFVWSLIEPAKGSFSWGRYDAIMSAAKAVG